MNLKGYCCNVSLNTLILNEERSKNFVGWGWKSCFREGEEETLVFAEVRRKVLETSENVIDWNMDGWRFWWDVKI